jgi:branched-chain amino acid transport system permease protein
MLAAYGVAMVPLALMTAGAVLAIEMSYRLSTQPELGTRMRVLWRPIDAASPWPWLVAAVSVAGGLLLFRATFRLVAGAWKRALARA